MTKSSPSIVKSMVKILSIFMAFLENMNFTGFMDSDDISCMSLCIMPFISLAAKQWKKLKHGRLIAVPVKKRDIR